MKKAKVRDLLAAGMEGDTSAWEPCPERAGDGSPSRRLELGSGFVLGQLPQGGFVLYRDGELQMTMAVSSLDPDGTFSGPGFEVTFDTFGGRRRESPLDMEELDRFMSLTFYRDGRALGGGESFMLSDELHLMVRQEGGSPPRFMCSVMLASHDGRVVMEAEGEAVYTPGGPAVVGDGFSMLRPTDMLALRRFRERHMDPSGDTRGYLEGAFHGVSGQVSEGRRPELASALARLRPGSRLARVPRSADEDDGQWDGRSRPRHR